MNLTACFTFLPDLNDFLAADRRSGKFEYTFGERQSVKHLIEAAGVPHTEIGALLVNRQPVGLDYMVQSGDQVEVHPAAAALDLPAGDPRFILDNHLGRLAAYLRMMGFDTLYRNNYDDEELARTASLEDRILITRDRRLLMRKEVRRGYCPRSLDSRQQFMEVVRRFALLERGTPFRRCLRCNTPLQPVPKAAVLERLEPLTRQYYDEFHRCPTCGQVYWKGSHYERMQDLINQVRRGAAQP